MPNINILIKPASSLCNLKCKYCFYHAISDEREIKSHGFMSEDTLETIVKKGLEYCDNLCGFTFQGGEPTLIGLEFYKKLLKLQEKYNVNNIKIQNAIQTNGMLIDEEWAEFLSTNNFLVGLSLDGDKESHNLNRVCNNGKDTFKEVMETVKLFNKYNVQFNILSVITSNIARYPKRIYKFLKDNNFKYIQFIPCIDPFQMKRGESTFSLTPKNYGVFLNEIFDLWYEDYIKGNYISIRFFDNIIYMLLGEEPESCALKGKCSCNLVIESDGSAYPCDFYVLDKWKLGNINCNDINNLIKTDTSLEFISSSINVDNECISCRWKYLCRGGCRRDREDHNENRVSKNYFCHAYKDFFTYSYDRLVDIARHL